MTTMHVGDGIAWFVCVGIIVVGLRFLFAPRASAAGFGVAVSSGAGPADAYLAVKAIRDIASGLIALALIVAGPPHALGWFLLAAAVIPLGDALIVLRYHGPRVAAFVMHGGTAALMLVGAWMLLT
jgi:hypothetical protein